MIITILYENILGQCFHNASTEPDHIPLTAVHSTKCIHNTLGRILQHHSISGNEATFTFVVEITTATLSLPR